MNYVHFDHVPVARGLNSWYPSVHAQIAEISPKKHVNTIYHRRKFRSQTFDNMDRWKSKGGKSQRGEEKK